MGFLASGARHDCGHADVTRTQAADDSPPSHLLPTAVSREPAAGVEMWEQDTAGFGGGDKRERSLGFWLPLPLEGKSRWIGAKRHPLLASPVKGEVLAPRVGLDRGTFAGSFRRRPESSLRFHPSREVAVPTDRPCGK